MKMHGIMVYRHAWKNREHIYTFQQAKDSFIFKKNLLKQNKTAPSPTCYLLRRAPRFRHGGRWCTTVPEFQNNSELKTFYIKLKLSSSSIRIQPQKLTKIHARFQIYKDITQVKAYLGSVPLFGLN